MRPYLVLVCLLGLGSQASAQALLPAGWPARIELGMSDSPGGAAAMRRTAPFGFRYQYLAGGANTGSGWATWNANGDFARFYIQDSVANGIIPSSLITCCCSRCPAAEAKAALFSRT